MTLTYFDNGSFYIFESGHKIFGIVAVTDLRDSGCMIVRILDSDSNIV